VRAFVGSFLSLAGAVCGLTWLYLGMRKVMEIGGSCADGGPYVSRQPCPEGVPLLMVGGILGGLVCVGLFVFFASKLGAGYTIIAAFAWPALFLSLGWNFLEFGLDPPPPAEGAEWGWLVCAVVFGLMGGLPLLGLARPSVLRKALWPPDPEPFSPAANASRIIGTAESIFGRPAETTLMDSRPSVGDPAPWSGSPYTGSPPTTGASPAPAKPPPPADGVVAQLERLAALRDRGALDAAEYERAKKAVLDG
jgi:putative oligomerization/nucleic acid binding protein